jgi:hypothetical protein
MCVGKFQRTSVKINQYLWGAGLLVILASPRQEFSTSTSRCGSFFLSAFFADKESG